MSENPTLESFAPLEEDFYYPAEETEEREALQYPRLAGWAEGRAILAWPDSEEPRALSVGDSAGDWEVVATLDSPKCVVLERNFARWGIFAYLADTGVVATVRKAIGRLEAIVLPSRVYPDNYVAQVMASQEDVLGLKVLAAGEPSYESVAGYLPDVSGYAFLGVPERADKVAIEPSGLMGVLPDRYGPNRIERPVFEPQRYVPDLSATQAKRGLLGGWLPAVDYGFCDATRGQGWEQMALCAAQGGEETPGALFAALKVHGRWRHFSLEPVEELASGARFFAALLNLRRHWQRFFDGAMSVSLPEQRLTDACHAGIARARITCQGCRPLYGVGAYAKPEHAGFPPTTLFLTAACLEWGLLDVARDFLDYYLETFVQEDGSFDYYGPAVSEYGMLLDRAAQFVRTTGDREWLRRRLDPLKRICGLLLRLRRESLEKTIPGEANRGLLFGSPEADTRKEVDYYYSGCVWAWRGFVELGRVLADQEDESSKALARELTDEAARLRADVLRSMEQSVLDGDPPFLPPYPGIDAPFPSMSGDPRASYTNYRYWLEMLSADFLPDSLTRAVLDYRRMRGGEFFGTTRFMNILDDWPLAHHAWSLLSQDEAEQYLLTLYGHLAHHQMRGTFCAYEGVHLRDVDCRPYAADYCTPVQLTIPLMTKWMLVFEERDGDRLWLCKAAPRRWFAPGQTFSVHAAPTRWGKVSFEVESESTRIVVRLHLPERPPDEVLLRLRRPAAEVPTRVLVNGNEQASFDSARDAIVLRRPEQRLEVVAEY